MATVKPSITYTYILKCNSGEFYCGKTNNFTRRMKEHRQGKGWFRMKGRNKFIALLSIYGDIENNIKRFGVEKFANLFIYRRINNFIEKGCLKGGVSRP